MPIAIILADDHGLLRAGLRNLLNAEADFRVVGEAADGDIALRLALEGEPDVLLADLCMPGASGIEIARALHAQASTTRVLIVSMHEDSGLVREAAGAGAAGYVSKRAAETELIQAVRVVAAGGTWWPGPALCQGNAARTGCARTQEWLPLPPRNPTPLPSPGAQSLRPPGAHAGPAPVGDVAGPQSLDEEELALLRLVAEALPDDQIATALGRDAASVARARQTLAARLGCKGRIALMNYARSHALRGRPV